MVSTRTDVEAVLASRSAAIWKKDLDRLMSFYSPDIVYFDIVPPLQYVGAAALRGRFQHWFESYKGPIGQEMRDVNVLADGEIAIASMLIRASGTLQNGDEIGVWVRATSSCQRSNDRWLITHEHVSLPVDLASGNAVTNVAP